MAAAKIVDVHFVRNFHLDNFDMMKSGLLAQLVSFVNRGFRAWEEAFDEESNEEENEEEAHEYEGNEERVEWVKWEDEDRIGRQMESDEEERNEEEKDKVEGVEEEIDESEEEEDEAEKDESEEDEEVLNEQDLNGVRGDEEKGANNCLTVHFLMVRNIPAFFDYVKPRWKRQKMN